MDNSSLVYSHQIRLEDFCSNFLGARAYTVKYFESRILYQVPVEEICLALVKAHPYLAPKEPMFSAPTKKQVAVLIPPHISAPAAPLMHNAQCEPEASNTTPAAGIFVQPQPTRRTNGSEAKPTKASVLTTTAPKYTFKSKAPAPSYIKDVVAKPALPVLAEPASDEEDDAASVEAISLNAQEVERNEIEVLLVKKPRLTSIVKASLPPPCAYHPLTGEPLAGVLYVLLSAPLKCAPLLPPAGPSSKAKGCYAHFTTCRISSQTGSSFAQ
ncbi:hypothetical protein EDD85DRAFT_798286 [Armillaria nabsnona]|nr:hypothetical protein EDD85DRAFT_798286 [Armillaria nabsnona]